MTTNLHKYADAYDSQRGFNGKPRLGWRSYVPKWEYVSTSLRLYRTEYEIDVEAILHESLVNCVPEEGGDFVIDVEAMY